MKACLLISVALLVMAVTQACKQPEPVLWVPQDARIEIGPRSNKDGSTDVSFVMDDADPIQVERLLMAHFSETKWRMRRSPSSPGATPASPERGWVQGPRGVLPADADGRVVPGATSLVWHGEWENENGDEIEFHLYTTLPPRATSGRLVGYAMLTRGQ